MVELAKPIKIFSGITQWDNGHSHKVYWDYYKFDDIAAERVNWQRQLTARLEELKALQSEREAWQKEIAKWEAYTNDLEEEYAIEGAVTIQDKKAIRRRYGL